MTRMFVAVDPRTDRISAASSTAVSDEDLRSWLGRGDTVHIIEAEHVTLGAKFYHPELRLQTTLAERREALQTLGDLLERRLLEKGPGIYITPHETLGNVTEEFYELIGAVQSNSSAQIQHELLDTAVACLFGYISLNRCLKELDWTQPLATKY